MINKILLYEKSKCFVINFNGSFTRQYFINQFKFEIAFENKEVTLE